MSISLNRRFAMTLVAGLGVGLSSVALAHVDVGVNIGVPGAVYAPEPVYAPPQQVYVQPPPAIVIGPGWYGDRYYDGRRYWERREWEERHGREREWHDACDYRGGHRDDWGHDREHGEQRGDWHHDHENDGGRGDH
ncbi:PXPV repeat protein [Caballeronia sp. LjRoot31]|uniref:PXPV repeat protein n=1 Tax=Caballeronia sp. LjRoot31 TaxID=3342324 RepID=UPI003ECC28F7